MGAQARARVEALRPARTPEQARARMLLTEQALDALTLGQPVPAKTVPALDGVLQRLERGGVATAEELRDVAQTLTSARSLRPYARERQDAQPQLGLALDSDPSLDRLGAELDESIDASGRILDQAAPELAQARRRVRGLRQSLLDKLEQLTTRYADVLRERQHLERDGRFALPVRADAHRRVEGIVLGSSGSGATLFIEPRQITELGNRLKMEEGEVERQEARVLASLSAAVARLLPQLSAAHEACIVADVMAAFSSWAQHAKAIALQLVPEAVAELRAMRHPLLVAQGGPVVPSELSVESGRALVISGPNAGGKTVALKTLGLLVWMAQCGLPLPVAEGSRIGWFSAVRTAFGDQQSLERSLSTFSAEIAALRIILDGADGHTLVLLDELAGGTDPEEGSALAAAVLETLVACGAAVVATTHYERLKELASDNDRFQNASVGFDFEQMQPTFELTMGIPGASSALAVAARHGLSATVLARARALLPEVTIQREQLLTELEVERRALAQARTAAQHEAERVVTLRQELEAERQIARRKERQRLADEAAALTQEVRDARAKLRGWTATLQRKVDGPALREATREIDAAGKVVAFDSPLSRALRPAEATTPVAPPAGSAASAPLEPGTRVFVPRLGVHAEVVERSERGQVRVQAGAFSTRIPVDQLTLTPARAGKAAAPGQPRRREPRKAKPVPVDGALEAPLRTSANTCDLRGERVEEALAEVDAFVDRCLSANEPVGFVLHGHGTGALKRAVREHLAASQLIAHARPAELREGGDGFTVFWLRD